MARKGPAYIWFIAEYEDGTKHPFQILEHVIYKSDGVAWLIASERQAKGELPIGSIKEVKRAPVG